VAKQCDITYLVCGIISHESVLLWIYNVVSIIKVILCVFHKMLGKNQCFLCNCKQKTDKKERTDKSCLCALGNPIKLFVSYFLRGLSKINTTLSALLIYAPTERDPEELSLPDSELWSLPPSSLITDVSFQPSEDLF